MGSALQELAHEEAQIVYVDWLVEDGHCSGQQSPPVQLVVAKSRDENHGRQRLAMAQAGECIDPGPARHANVRQDKIESIRTPPGDQRATKCVEKVNAIGDLHHVVPVSAKCRCHEIAESGIVLRHQQPTTNHG